MTPHNPPVARELPPGAPMPAVEQRRPVDAPASTGVLPPDDPRHGTTNGYTNLRCRCQDCRDAWTEYTLTLRYARTLDPDDERHGTYSAYVNYRCRCDDCRAAHLAYSREYRRANS